MAASEAGVPGSNADGANIIFFFNKLVWRVEFHSEVIVPYFRFRPSNVILMITCERREKKTSSKMSIYCLVLIFSTIRGTSTDFSESQISGRNLNASVTAHFSQAMQSDSSSAKVSTNSSR